MTLPVVSVVVVNYNGRHHLEPCFNSLIKQDYPVDRLELILVDNASQDGSLELMAERFPTVKIIHNSTNKGFAPAVNQGARAATGQYVALINNDAYADPGWIKEMVTMAEARRDEGVICVGAKMLDWYGDRIDFVGGGVNFYGMGNQFFHDQPTDAVQVTPHPLLFACGGAMLCDQQVFVETGGFDEDYFAYFEDVDFGWRLWVLGFQVWLCPDAVVYHRKHGTSNVMYAHQINTLFERNALLTIIKNYDADHLQRMLGVSLLLMIGRSLMLSGGAINRKEFDLRQRDASDGAYEMQVPKAMMSQLAALQDILETFPDVWQKRQQIQARRSRADAEILPLFKAPLSFSQHVGPYMRLQEMLMHSFDIQDMFAAARAHRVLIISSDPIYDKLAGPGIRAVEMARALTAHCHVVLAAPQQADIEIDGVECVVLHRDDPVALERLLTEVEVVIVQGFALRHYPSIKSAQRMLVVDLYDPFHLENLHTHSSVPLEEAYQRNDVDRAVINELLELGDFFICASERQRDFWLGALGSVGRLNSAQYQHDPAFRSLLDVVPFGLPPEPPVQTQAVLKGVVPGIEPTDTVLLWGGGIWEWFDPLTIIRAMRKLRQQRPDIKLFFMGHHHPNPADVPSMPMYDRAMALAQDLGVYNSTVFFNDHWVPYAERANYLVEADIGVSAHMEHVETRFAFRTRLLDYMWAGLPMIVSEGDTLADVVRERGLGYVVGVGDIDGWVDAIFTLADRRTNRRASYAVAFEAARQAFAWPEVLKPLLQFSQRPRYAPDKDRVTASPLSALISVSSSDTYPGLLRRVEELEDQIRRKNQHIAYLEELLRRIEGGKVMRALNTVARLRARRR